MTSANRPKKNLGESIGLIAGAAFLLLLLSLVATGAGAEISLFLIGNAAVIQLFGGAVMLVGLWGLVARYLTHDTGSLGAMIPSIALVLAGSIPLGQGWASALGLALLGVAVILGKRQARPTFGEDGQGSQAHRPD